LCNIVSGIGNEGLVLMDYQAEIRTKIEKGVPKVMECLWDDSWDVRSAALNTIGILVQYRE
jgi:hypothetical protein